MGKNPRKIAVVTGTRAEYGLLIPLLQAIRAEGELCLQLVVTGAHLSPEYGLTCGEIENDGFVVAARVEMLLSSDTGVGTAKSLGLGVIGFADVWQTLQPDWVVLLGDRFELMAAVLAALTARIPMAHIHGGETSQGAIDEAIRHGITKMAHLHFVAAEPYRRRVIQLGEDPTRVFNVGALALERLANAVLPDREAWQREAGFALGRQNFLVTYHPVTLQAQGPEAAVAALFAALDRFPDARLIFTSANADAGGRVINRMVATYVQGRREPAVCFANLGPRLYPALLKQVDLVVGNSSSGLIEAPFYNVPTVNIGDRQGGRLRAASVFDCQPETEAIVLAMKTALAAGFRQRMAPVVSPYGRGESSRIMVQILRDTPLEGILQKRFYDQ